MANEDLAGEAPAQRRIGYRAQRARSGVGGFVDVEIQIPTLALGEREQRIERALNEWTRYANISISPGQQGATRTIDSSCKGTVFAISNAQAMISFLFIDGLRRVLSQWL